MLISDFTLHLRRKNVDVPDIYFILLEAAGISPSLVFNQNAKTKDRGGWLLFKVWTSKAAKLYAQGAAAYGSLRNLTKTSRLLVSKLRKFLYSKASYTKFTLATRKFKRSRAFGRFRKKNWCMDLAYVDKLAKEKNSVKYKVFTSSSRLVWQNGICWRNENKRFPRNCESFFNHDYNKDTTEKDLGWQGDRICWIV